MPEAKQVYEPVKDEDSAHPVASAWRQTFQNIVKAFVRGDYGIVAGLDSVAPLSPRDADQIRSYIADYGETLVDLPDASWETSIAQWMGGYWDVLVDLWTVESGASDMVIAARVFEVGNGFRIEIHSVHVP